VNEKLEKWCKEKGIEIRLTAPYSPSQNGVAERMNRTLVELSCTMLTAKDLPEFLWEYAVMHAAYLRNRSYTKHLPKTTPYEGWNNVKPNVSHLREFGAPVWILLQGQKEERKMLPKSKRRVYVGYEDGAKAVKYYNAATRNILTSRNFRHINPTEKPSQEEIEVIPDTMREPDMTREPDTREGESTGSAPPGHDVPTHNLGPKKRMRNEIEDDININEPRKTRGIRTDYKRLQDPFTEEDEEDENTFLSIEEVYAIIAGDEITGLNEARNSPEWPKWQQAMNEEMDLLNEMGTWELVQKPPNAIPIANKWVFVKK
jgi:hypothetical protein